MGRARGPELSTVGAKRSRDWLIEHVRNPKSHNPQSRMPAYDGKINDNDLQLLADYLASLK
jgi:cbb3-type cytochrome oxidase cytochrome c subunit